MWYRKNTLQTISNHIYNFREENGVMNVRFRLNFGDEWHFNIVYMVSPTILDR